MNNPKISSESTLNIAWEDAIRTVKYFVSESDFERAEIAALSALELAEGMPFDDRRMGITLEILAEVLFQTRQFPRCAPIMMRLIEMYKRCLGKSHLDTATICYNAAILYHTWGRFKEAECLYQKSLLVKAHNIGKNHPEVKNIMRRLALLYNDMGRVHESNEIRQSMQKLEGVQFTRSGQFDVLPPELLNAKGLENRKK